MQFSRATQLPRRPRSSPISLRLRTILDSWRTRQGASSDRREIDKPFSEKIRRPPPRRNHKTGVPGPQRLDFPRISFFIREKIFQGFDCDRYGPEEHPRCYTRVLHRTAPGLAEIASFYKDFDVFRAKLVGRRERFSSPRDTTHRSGDIKTRHHRLRGRNYLR